PLLCELCKYSLYVQNTGDAPSRAANCKLIRNGDVSLTSFGWIDKAVVVAGPDLSLGTNGVFVSSEPRFTLMNTSSSSFSRARPVTLHPGDSINYFFHPFNLLWDRTAVVKPGKYSVVAHYRYISYPDLVEQNIQSQPFDITITEAHIAEWKKWPDK